MRRPSRGLVAYLVLIAAFILVAYLISGGTAVNGAEIAYNDMLNLVENGHVEVSRPAAGPCTACIMIPAASYGGISQPV